MLGWGTAISGVLGLLGMGSQSEQTQAQLDAANNLAFAQSTINAQQQVTNAQSKRNSGYVMIGVLLIITFVVYIAFKGKQ